MVSWAVTGATRGIGFGWIEKLSVDANNQVFAIIRNLGTAGPLQELAAKRKNIHILVSDIASPRKLDDTAAEVSKITSGSLDVLLLNAGSTTGETSQLPPSAFHGKEEELENEINENIKNNLTSNMYIINSFLGLIRNGQEKKIIFTSSQSADVEFTRVTGFTTVLGYSAAKAAMNVVIAKYAAELAPEGIKTLSIMPGWVDTDAAKAVTGNPEVRKFVLSLFHKIDASVEGPIPVEESVSCQLQAIQNLSEKNSGQTITHRGDSPGARLDIAWF